MKIYILSIFNIVLFSINFLFSQKTNTPNDAFLKTKSGNQYIGKIIEEKSDTIIFKIKTGDELIFKQRDILNVKKIEKEIEKCGVFDVYMKGYSSYYTGRIKINGSVVIAKKEKSLNRYYSKALVDWIEFIPGDCRVEPTNYYYLKTKNKEVYDGHLKSINYEDVVLSKPNYLDTKVKLSEVAILRPMVKRTSLFGHERTLFLASTGFNLRKGDMVVSSIGLVHNSIAYGVNDHFSLNTGTLFWQPFVRAKLSLNLGDYIHWSLGGGMFPWESVEWGTALSFGSPDYFVNAGFSFFKGELDYETFDKMDAFHLGASMRTGQRSRLFAEYISFYLTTKVFNGIEAEKRNLTTFGYGWLYKRGMISLTYSFDVQELRESIGMGMNGYDQYIYESTPRVAASIQIRLGRLEK